MKVKTSVTLSEDLLDEIDKLGDQFRNRSEFLETAARAFISQLQRSQQDARDLEIINRNAKRLNREAADVLAFQGEL